MANGEEGGTFSIVILGACSQFSLMQYSNDFETHFTFKDFKDKPNPRLLVEPISQLFGQTHTATGIREVM